MARRSPIPAFFIGWGKSTSPPTSRPNWKCWGLGGNHGYYQSGTYFLLSPAFPEFILLNSEELKEFGRYIHDENEMDFVGGDPFFYQSCNNEDIINEIELTVENQLIKYSLRPKIKDRFPNSQSLNFREVAKKLVRTELEMDETKSRTDLVKMRKYFENLKNVSSLFREVLKDELE